MNFRALAGSVASLAVLIAGPAFGLIAGPAFGQGTFGLTIENCSDYVARAMSQVQMASGCSVSGPSWSADPADHAAWCKRASARERGREDDARRNALTTCRGDFGTVQIKSCNEYVARSRTQLELAQALSSSCTFDGMRWSSNVVQHMHWCNRTPVDRHAAEDAARRRELASCAARSN